MMMKAIKLSGPGNRWGFYSAEDELRWQQELPPEEDWSLILLIYDQWVAERAQPVVLPASVETEEDALAWWAAHGHELDPEFVPPEEEEET